MYDQIISPLYTTNQPMVPFRIVKDQLKRYGIQNSSLLLNKMTAKLEMTQSTAKSNNDLTILPQSMVAINEK